MRPAFHVSVCSKRCFGLDSNWIKRPPGSGLPGIAYSIKTHYANCYLRTLVKCVSPKMSRSEDSACGRVKLMTLPFNVISLLIWLVSTAQTVIKTISVCCFYWQRVWSWFVLKTVRIGLWEQTRDLDLKQSIVNQREKTHKNTHKKHKKNRAYYKYHIPSYFASLSRLDQLRKQRIGDSPMAAQAL